MQKKLPMMVVQGSQTRNLRGKRRFLPGSVREPNFSCRFATLATLLAWILCGGLLASSTLAADPDAADKFENSIRPLLAERCFSCHGPKKQWASLRLDSLDGMLKGGDTGPAIVAGKPAESELLRRVQEQDEDLRMPPAETGKPLSAEQVKLLTEWIRQGAIWPESSTAHSTKEEAWKTHWAFQPVVRTELPAVEDTAWVKQPIDHFIEKRLKEAGLSHSSEADRHTLIRRAAYDVTGLPPSPTEVAEFLNDNSADAYERLIERLLASPHFGEKWGRH